MTATLTPSLRWLSAGLCVAVLALTVACAHGGRPGADQQLVSVIVQAPDLQHAVRAVALAGGTVTHELGVIRSVGATVTPAQLELLHKVKDVRIHENHAVSLLGDATSTAARDGRDEGPTARRGGSAPSIRQPRN